MCVVAAKKGPSHGGYFDWRKQWPSGFFSDQPGPIYIIQ